MNTRGADRAASAGGGGRAALVAVLLAALLVGVGVVARPAATRLAATVASVSLPRVRLPAGALSPSPAGAPVVYLVAGSDARTGLAEPLPGLGRLTGRRADLVWLWAVDPRRGVRVLALPRDVRVDVPRHGAAKLGGTVEFGVPALVDAVRRLTGVGVQHYVEVDFAGFAELVDAAGGLDVRLPDPVRDRRIGLALPAGAVHLDGRTALLLMRTRDPEHLTGGRWAPMTSGDLERIARQQDLVSELLAGARGAAPWTLLRMARAVAGGTRVDTTLGAADLLAARRAAAGPSSRVLTCTLPSRYALPADRAASPFPPDHDGSAVFRSVAAGDVRAAVAWLTFAAGTCPGGGRG